MKKYIFLTLALALAFAGTAWGQTTEYFQVTSVHFAYTSGNPFVYDGTAKTYITDWDSNCSINDGEITGNTATNAGSYTATISSHCYGHGVGDHPDYYEEFHVGSVSYNWTILPRPLTDAGVTITTKDVTWTGNEIEITSAYDPIVYNNGSTNYTLVKGTDYDVYTTVESTPGKFKNEGRYTIVFVGKGNYVGVVTKTFDVKKQLSADEATTGIHYAIPEQVLKIKADYSAYDALAAFDIKVTDSKSHATLNEGEDYTLKFFAGDAAVDNYLDSNPSNDPTPITLADITAEGKYWVVIEGVAPKYTAKIKKAFYVVKEFQSIPGAIDDGNGAKPVVAVRITKAGYPVAADAPAGTTTMVPGEVMVAMAPTFNTTNPLAPCIDKESNRCEIPATTPANTTTIYTDITTYTYNVVGIQNSAFAGCSKLRWIDIKIPADTWTPSSLDRDVINIDTPFCGVPKSAIVYLFGTTVTGENYVYKFGTNDYRCAQYRIYEDLSGEQTLYSK